MRRLPIWAARNLGSCTALLQQPSTKAPSPPQNSTLGSCAMTIQHGRKAGDGASEAIINIIIIIISSSSSSSSSSSNMRARIHNGHTGERGTGAAPYVEQC